MNSCNNCDSIKNCLLFTSFIITSPGIETIPAIVLFVAPSKSNISEENCPDSIKGKITKS